MEQVGICYILHYLNDFLLLGSLASPQCASSLAITLEVCNNSGVLVLPYYRVIKRCSLLSTYFLLSTHIFIALRWGLLSAVIKLLYIT